ncbi:MAG: S24/S26 family peptidase [Methanosarcinaceae archaeon]|nr:S24/S26 family peptidase [Methanosarcinaceae archaeon]
MPEIIIYTAGFTLIILILAYMQVNKKELFQQIFRHVPLTLFFRRRNAINEHLNVYATHFKNRDKSKALILSIILTLLLAFVLYNYVFFTVPVSNSMRPTFEAGDLVLMQKFDTTPEKDDIIMFGMAVIGNDKVITHRVYSVTTEGVKTKGDAGRVDYWTVSQKQIYAKAVTIGNKPIVIKSIGSYFLDKQISSTYASEFGFMQFITRGGKQLALLIFVICLVAYTWISVNDIKKQNKYRRRN